MLTGSEPYKLRGILSKGARALMTRFGPSHDEGPGTQPHIGPTLVSEFSVRICYTMFYQYYDKYNVFNREEDKPVVRTMTLIFHTVFYQLVQSVPIDRAVAQYYLCI